VLNRDSIIATIAELNVTPRVLRHLGRFLGDPNADLSPAINALKSEPVLTAAILAGCNTIAQRSAKKEVSLENAIHRLGFRETYRIALLATFRQGLRIPGLPDNTVSDRIWSRAIIAACAMETWAPEEKSPLAFTVGLLHLIGSLILARRGWPMAGFTGTTPSFLAKAQEAVVGLGYPEAGAIALEEWEFPKDISVPVRCQLTPADAGEFAELTYLLARGVKLAQFIEQSRNDEMDPAEMRFASIPITPDVIAIEARATDLMERFYIMPLKRPWWATK
jgi:HD-like signal output (HDOD) protein